MPDSGIGGIVAFVAAIVVLIAIAIFCYAIIVLAARMLHRILPATMPPRDPAMDALRTRLATGEIDEAEFERLRSVLQGR